MAVANTSAQMISAAKIPPITLARSTRPIAAACPSRNGRRDRCFDLRGAANQAPCA
jgi:hypothetical protein